MPRLLRLVARLPGLVPASLPLDGTEDLHGSCKIRKAKFSPKFLEFHARLLGLARRQTNGWKAPRSLKEHVCASTLSVHSLGQLLCNLPSVTKADRSQGFCVQHLEENATLRPACARESKTKYESGMLACRAPVSRLIDNDMASSTFTLEPATVLTS